MRIFLCTYKRPLKQVTWGELPPSVQDKTTLVVQAREASQYDGYPFLVLPENIQDIASTRDWLIAYAEGRGVDKICQIDDDLTFAYRRIDDPTRFGPATARQMEYLFEDIEDLLDKHAHVGVSGREGANRKTEPYLYNGRKTRILGYRTDVLLKEGVRHNRLPFMTDFDTNLQLLRLGYSCAIVNWMVQNQGSSNAPGGCSETRTIAGLGESAEMLHKLHTPFVTTVIKETKSAWQGQRRKDVRIQWKQAYAEGVRNYGEQKP